MMKISTLFWAATLSLSTFTAVKAQTYCQPNTSSGGKKWAHANSQSFYSLKVSSAGNEVFTYTDEACANQYNWIQDTQGFSVTAGKEIVLDVRSGIWTWDIQVGFDWDGDGDFEDLQRAFSTLGKKPTQQETSWNPKYKDTYASADWRKAEKERLGHRGVVYHQFKFTVPADAKAGKTRMRILCDGDGGTADFEMCSPVGYAGSMHDFGITVAKENVVVKPVFDIVDGTYKVDQMITITSATPDAKIYYTIDGQDPTATSGTLYNAPVKVSVPEGTTEKVTLKAIAIKDGMQTSDVTTAVYTIQKAWSIVKGTVHPTENRYVTSATTDKAKQNLNFTQTEKPSMVYINTGSAFTVETGTNFDLHVQCSADMKWDHAIVFVDWNHNYSFDDEGEQLFKVGEETKGNDEVVDFTRNITVPANAKVGQTRMRIQFTDAWHKKNEPGHTHSGEDVIEKGGVYDFVVNIEDAVLNNIKMVSTQKDNDVIYTLEGVKLNKKASELPKGIYIINGKKVVIK